jgi:hypothetical protein
MPAIILGRCPRLVWIALSALAAKQLQSIRAMGRHW